MKKLLLKIAKYIDRKYGAPAVIKLGTEISFYGRTYCVVSYCINADPYQLSTVKFEAMAVEGPNA